jgi:hypothetical protein
VSVVLYIIDHQVGELEDFSLLEKKTLDVNIQRLTNGFTQRKLRSVHVAYSGDWVDFEPMPEGVGLFKDTPKENRQLLIHRKGLRFCHSLPPRALVAYKNSNSLQNEPSAYKWLEANKITDVVLAGLFEVEPGDEEHTYRCCVSQTAIDFALKGLTVTIAAEGTNVSVRNKAKNISLAMRRETHEKYNVAVDPIDEILERYDASGSRPALAHPGIPLGGFGL